MEEKSSDGYANLPDELLEDILNDSTEIIQRIKPLFEELENKRKSLREKLNESSIIKRASELENPPSPSVAAVDGGQVIEKSIGADILLAVAVGVEGLVREDKRQWNSVQYKKWQEALPHNSEANPKIIRGAMTTLELLVLANTPHDVIIADGSHQTPIIGINSLTSMSSLSDEMLQDLMLKMVNELQVTSSLKKAMENPNIVYMVKYDSSQDIGQSILQDFSLNVDDKTTMTLILDSDEFTKPLPVGQTDKSNKVWSDLNISISTKFNFVGKEKLKQELNEAIILPKNRKIYFTYYKPYEWSPAFRIEIKEKCARSEIELAKVLKAIKEQVVSTEIQEPYPQYLADLMAKSVSDGLDAIKAVIQSQLSDEPKFLRLLTQSYRTY